MSRHETHLNAEAQARLDTWLAAPTYEIVPVEGVEDLVSETLPAGARIAVPHLPVHGLERTVRVAVELAGRGFTVVPHVGARSVEDEGQLMAHVETLRAAGVDEVLVVGGDPTQPRGPFPTAGALVAALSTVPDPFARIGVAGHPEGHALVHEQTLTEALLVKQAQGVAYVATQMCFDARAIARWIGQIRAAGVTLPVVLGLPGEISKRRLLTLGVKIGVGTSLRALRRQRGLRRQITGSSFSPLELLGEVAELTPAAQAVESLHVYTFNALEETARALIGLTAARHGNEG